MVQRTLLDYTTKRQKSPPSDVVVEVENDSLGSPPFKSQRKRSQSPSSSARGEVVRQRVEHASKGLVSLLVDPSWRELLLPLTSAPNFTSIEEFIDREVASGKTVLPPRPLIFSAFNSAPLERLRVVLLGQDPYHNIGQAHGLCFSVRPGVRPPPSLVNMYKELATDMPGFRPPPHGYLQPWAEQGVLMLNATLTVEAHKANSHAACGWQTFTDGVIQLLSKKHPRPLVFLLWGGFARKKAALIDRSRHIVIESAHPSPLSATKWWGSRPFSKCNAALLSLGEDPIDWNLPLNISEKHILSLDV